MKVLETHMQQFVAGLKSGGATMTPALQQILEVGFFTGCVCVLQEVQDTVLDPKTDGSQKLARVETLMAECLTWTGTMGEILAKVRAYQESKAQGEAAERRDWNASDDDRAKTGPGHEPGYADG